MLRLNRLVRHTNNSTKASLLLSQKQHEEKNLFNPLPSSHFFRNNSIRFLEFYKLGNKEAIEKERARLKDEMNRGYFADMAELEKHGGKVSVANKIIVPAMAAIKFPSIDVNFSDGKTLKLPVGNEDNADKSALPKVSLLCLTFRANSQAMIDSWTKPFISEFSDAKNIQLYEVSFIDSWLLRRFLIKKLLLRIMKKSTVDESSSIQKQIVYSFDDHYYFRKELKILNLLTGYVFLLDKFGRIRWQGSGFASEEELFSLLSCTSLLLDEK
ncbi:mitochondrial ATPase complex subunit ATP10 [Euphorbia lathyris]|uniref:mitochondrial ATPase complex subunit ATP10 n=1 Tax=Euphorbia lathyris TaxID=212925 RepID=UPI0033141E5E